MGFGKTLWIISRRLMMLLAFVVVFIASAALAYYFSRGAEIAVPNVVGKTEEQAKEIANHVGLKIEVIDIYDSQEAPGKVIRQFPKAGAVIRKGGSTILKINVSRVRSSELFDTQPKIPLPDPPLDLTPWGEDLCGIPVVFDFSDQSNTSEISPHWQADFCIV